MIRAHFGFQITGAHFLNFANLHLEADERPENLFQRLMAFVEDTLLRANSLSHHGEDKCGNRFFAWESTSVKIWGNSLAAVYQYRICYRELSSETSTALRTFEYMHGLPWACQALRQPSKNS